MRRNALLLLAILGLAGGALATPAEGTLTVAGPFTLPESAQLDMTPVALLHNDTRSARDFSLVAPEVRLTVLELRRVVVGLDERSIAIPMSTEPTVTEYRLTNAAFTLATGNHSGFFGLYPEEGARLSLTSASGVDIEPRAQSTVQYGQRVQEDSPRERLYAREVQGAHLLLHGTGASATRDPAA